MAAAAMTILATAELLLICIAASAAAQDTVTIPGFETECLTALLNTFDCRAFVEEGSNLTAPGSACCPELAGLVVSNRFCLCQVLRRTEGLGAKINSSRMHELPAACDISTSPDVVCSGDPAGEGVVPISLAPTFVTDLGPEIENSGGYGVRTTSRALSALVIVGTALSTLFLAS